MSLLITTHQCIWFTVLISVLIVSDQSAVPDMASSEKNFISKFIVFVHTSNKSNQPKEDVVWLHIFVFLNAILSRSSSTNPNFDSFSTGFYL